MVSSRQTWYNSKHVRRLATFVFKYQPMGHSSKPLFVRISSSSVLDHLIAKRITPPSTHKRKSDHEGPDSVIEDEAHWHVVQVRSPVLEGPQALAQFLSFRTPSICSTKNLPRKDIRPLKTLEQHAQTRPRRRIAILIPRLTKRSGMHSMFVFL